MGLPDENSPFSTILWSAPTAHHPSCFTSFPSFHNTACTEMMSSQTFLANPDTCMPCSTDRDGAGGVRPSYRQCCFPVAQYCQPPCSIHLRGSMARPTRWLCTLRSKGHPLTTQHSLPVPVSFPGGVETHRVRMKVSTIHVSSFSKLTFRNGLPNVWWFSGGNVDVGSCIAWMA
jgi:hypothetical protein